MNNFKIFSLILFTALIFSCQKSTSDLAHLQNIKIGDKLDVAINSLQLRESDLIGIEEPPLIYHGFSSTLNDGTEVYFVIERTPANPKYLESNNIYKQFMTKRIIGIAWVEKNRKKNHIGELPPHWVE